MFAHKNRADELSSQYKQARGKITEEIFDVLIAECDDLQSELQTELDYLLLLRDE
jgi:DNA-binding ferritin-like protein (Dps family)